ncbi:hypothetical protein PFUGPA_03298 [Plasmodium falciparum Palo Alto/Uganda]|uniref:Uncharacterized protein n=1 Tax=Plasmodium falciparum (isolate Palo Alto / Uganda) TaxID=57270 RepID=W4IY16_PLAFP|nr:hypothetical protein PFUGPA_03298 [Plasmodium falciparum Palo Alto/Uganda]
MNFFPFYNFYIFIKWKKKGVLNCS